MTREASLHRTIDPWAERLHYRRTCPLRSSAFRAHRVVISQYRKKCVVAFRSRDGSSIKSSCSLCRSDFGSAPVTEGHGVRLVDGLQGEFGRSTIGRWCVVFEPNGDGSRSPGMRVHPAILGLAAAAFGAEVEWSNSAPGAGMAAAGAVQQPRRSRSMLAPVAILFVAGRTVRARPGGRVEEKGFAVYLAF